MWLIQIAVVMAALYLLDSIFGEKKAGNVVILIILLLIIAKFVFHA